MERASGAGRIWYFNDDRGVWIVHDIHQIVYQMKKRFPDLPYILAGHSMGSLAVRCYLKRYDYEVDGAVICGSPSNNSLVLAAMGIMPVHEACQRGILPQPADAQTGLSQI
ncbi:MAG: alpha/beta fold hydrolase [Merdibacter sp.]